MIKDSEFVHLNAMTSFSGGIESPKKILEATRAMNMKALGIAERGNIFSWPMAEMTARDLGMQLLYGARLSVDMAEEGTFIATDQNSLRGLTRLVERRKNTLQDYWENRQGLIAILGPLAYQQMAWEWEEDYIFLEVNNFGDKESLAETKRRVELAKSLEASMVATNRVWCKQPHEGDLLASEMVLMGRNRSHIDRQRLEEMKMLTSNRTAYSYFLKMIEKGESGFEVVPNHPQGWLKSGPMMRSLFREIPEATENTFLIAKMAQEAKLPEIPVPQVPLPERIKNAYEYVELLCHKALEEQFGGKENIPAKYLERLNYEHPTIGLKKLDNFFLLMSRIMVRAREKKINTADMGSCTGSLVCYLLKINELDPIRNKLELESFDRFLSEETLKLPDIDHGIDRRKQEMFRGVVKEVCDELGAKAYRIATFSKYDESALWMIMRMAGFKDKEIKEAMKSVESSEGVPKYAEAAYQLYSGVAERDFYRGIESSHGSKLIVSPNDLKEAGGYWIDEDENGFPRIAIDKRKAAMVFSADGVSENGLSQKALLEERIGPLPAPVDNPAILREIFMEENHFPYGIPFIETEWLRKVCGQIARNTPKNWYRKADLVIAIAISRSGVWKNHNFDNYLERRSGRTGIEYSSPLIKEALGDTLGIIVYQEQALKLAKLLGKFSKSDLEKLREAISKNRDKRIMEGLREKFLTGAKENGMPFQEAWKWFDNIEKLVEYAFPKGHAIAQVRDIIWPLSVYKYYHPREFMEVVFELRQNHYFLMGRPDVYIKEAERLGFKVERRPKD